MQFLKQSLLQKKTLEELKQKFANGHNGQTAIGTASVDL